MTKKKPTNNIIVILIFIIGGVIGFLLTNIKTGYPLIDVILETIKPYFLPVTILLFIPLLIYFFMGIFSKNRSDTTFYKALRVSIHLSLIILGFYFLGLIFAFTFILLIRIELALLCLMIAALLVMILLWIIETILKKKYNVQLYNPFMWCKRKI